MSTLTVRIVFFASLRERLGDALALDLPVGSTVADARNALIALGQPFAAALGPGTVVRAALNHAMCADSATLQAGDELALFPPVTGG